MADKNTNDPAPSALSPPVGAPMFLWVMVGIMVAVEVASSASEAGYLPIEGVRQDAYLCCAFWRPLIWADAEAIYPGQAIYMFVSHAFVHGGFLHLALNAAIFLALGKGINWRIGPVKTIFLFVLSAAAGGFGYGFLADFNGPMVGASGAVFGFMGCWQAWEFQIRRQRGVTVIPVLFGIGGLALINIAMNFGIGGSLAWQAHLGGWLMGWMAAWTFLRRPIAR